MHVPTVLVVDDDESIREITKIALEAVGGWQVLTADGGVAALAAAREHRPDAVLLDVMMPDMDGPTTFRHLQDDPTTAHIPVVLLTAKVQIGEKQVWNEIAVAGVISKPFDPMTLHVQVAELLGWADGQAPD
jgi:CheY-like chemotaxis protein